MNIFKRERKPDELVAKACGAFEELSTPKGAAVRVHVAIVGHPRRMLT